MVSFCITKPLLIRVTCTALYVFQIVLKYIEFLMYVVLFVYLVSMQHYLAVLLYHEPKHKSVCKHAGDLFEAWSSTQYCDGAKGPPKKTAWSSHFESGEAGLRNH